VEGASANGLPDAVPEEVKEERRARFMQRQAGISRSRLAAKIGREIDVLVDEAQGATVIARSKADAPEIDGLVRVKGAAGARPGDMLRVRVTASDEHDLRARIAPL
jgi:ribosomal protein S12 methylthiotransferase